ITKEYKEETQGKTSKKLKAKTHRRLKQRFIDCFNKDSAEKYLDKTLIGFSLYKLNSDEDVKKIIIDNYKIILPHFEGVLFYLRTHFQNDSYVEQFIATIFSDETILFNHIVALCLKYFPDYPFDEKVYQKYTFEKHRHW